MADTVDTLDVYSGPSQLIRRITNISDGTGETTVVKVQRSTLVNAMGDVPNKLGLDQIWWSIQGFTSVRLYWDHTTDDEMEVLGTGNGARLYDVFGNDMGVLWDPGSAGGTGDIILTTAGAVSGATYDILLKIRLSGN